MDKHEGPEVWGGVGAKDRKGGGGGERDEGEGEGVKGAGEYRGVLII